MIFKMLLCKIPSDTVKYKTAPIKIYYKREAKVIAG